jgi:RNA polymerase sigma-70 factor (ECF subfamily)
LPDLNTLLERCRLGDALAWEAFVRQHQSRVYGVAFHYLRDAEEARDAAQDVFIKLYNKRDSWKIGDTFVSWMLTLTRNSCIDRIRRRKARPPASDLRVEDGPEIGSQGESPEESAFASARHRILYRAIGKLSEKSREIILLKDIQGLEFQQISKMLNLPVGTLKSRSHRARAELALKLHALDPGLGA